MAGSDWSMPIQRRLSRCAAFRVVPDPQKQSNTMLSGCDDQIQQGLALFSRVGRRLRVLKSPNVLHAHARLLVGINDLARITRRRPFNETGFVPLGHRANIGSPMASLWRQHTAKRQTRCTVFGLAGSVQRDGCVASTGRVGLGEQSFNIAICIILARLVPNRRGGFGIKQNHILNIAITDSVKIFGVALDARNVIFKIVDAKDFVHQHFDIISDFVVNMEIDRAACRQQLPNDR